MNKDNSPLGKQAAIQPQSSEQPNRHLKSRSQQKTNLLGSVAALGGTVLQTAANTALGIGKAATNQPTRWIGRLTQRAGQTITFVGSLPFLRNPFVQRIAGVLRLDWLIGMTDRVNFDKAELEVRQLFSLN